MKKIAVIGGKGRMGMLLSGMLGEKYEVAKIDLGDDLGNVKDCSLVIDFSTGENSAQTAMWCKENQKPLIIGATGQTNEENEIILCASREIPLMKAGNFSIGIAMVKQMIQCLKSINVDDVAIFEKHHKNKKDKPSGTAIELGIFLQDLFNFIPQVTAIRGGEEVGVHEVSLYFGSEVIKISHQAFSRKAFAEGVLIAVEYMLEKAQNGLYTFENLILSKKNI